MIYLECGKEKKMKKFFVLIIIVVFIGLSSISVYSKRIPPPEVKPISYEEIEYSAYGRDSVKATDEKTGFTIWIRQIYVIKYVPGLEQDVQDCFVTAIKLQDNKLLITNEKKYQYELDLKTLEVDVIKGALVIDREKDINK